MKYYTVELATVDGTSSQAIFERADYNTALSAYHSYMASALANDKCTTAMCMVIDNTGRVYINDVWNRQG